MKKPVISLMMLMTGFCEGADLELEFFAAIEVDEGALED